MLAMKATAAVRPALVAGFMVWIPNLLPDAQHNIIAKRLLRDWTDPANGEGHVFVKIRS